MAQSRKVGRIGRGNMTKQYQQVDVLMVSLTPLWPLDQGFRIHGHHMARGLTSLGLRVRVACPEALPDDAPSTFRRLTVKWPAASPQEVQTFTTECFGENRADSFWESLRESLRGCFRGWFRGSFRGRGWGGVGDFLRHRVGRYFGPDPQTLAGVIGLVQRYRPKTVIGVGMLSPLLLRGLGNHSQVRRIWYAADELVSFNLSCMRREPPRDWPARLRTMFGHALFERCFARGLDGAIGVSPSESRLLRTVAGVRRTISIPNGVDLMYFSPQSTDAAERSIAFWGNLDFEPNVDAVCWFAQRVWPTLTVCRPDARWLIIGRNPHPRVAALGTQRGIEVVGCVDDIRPLAQRAAVAILPMRCGGGIKNKLLEAAAMGRPIVASRHATKGLTFNPMARPFQICDHPDDWARAIRRLWTDQTTASQLGSRARRWAETHHSWTDAARALADWLDPQAEQPQPDATPTHKHKPIGTVAQITETQVNQVRRAA